MEQFRQWGIAVFAIMIIMLFASCQIGNVNPSETEISSVEIDQYGELSVVLPSSRGWDVAKYKLTASRTGEKSVVKETSDTTIKMRLKVGTWSFIAEGYDQNDKKIYLSDAVEGTVFVNRASSVSIMLKQQSGSVECPLSVSNDLSNDLMSKLNKIMASAATASEEFSIAPQEVNNQKATLTGLLVNVPYTITVNGYIGEEIYATGTKTLTLTEVGVVKKNQTITLNQCRVTPIECDKTNGARR